jgi:hypothetical protein
MNRALGVCGAWVKTPFGTGKQDKTDRTAPSLYIYFFNKNHAVPVLPMAYVTQKRENVL